MRLVVSVVVRAALFAALVYVIHAVLTNMPATWPSSPPPAVESPAFPAAGTAYYPYESLREDCWALSAAELGHEFPRILLAGVRLEFDEKFKAYRKPGTQQLVHWPAQEEPSPLPFVEVMIVEKSVRADGNTQHLSSE